MDGWNVDRWILGWMDGRVEGWMSGRVGGCMNARMDEWMCGWNDCSSSPPPSPLGRRRSSSRTVGRYGAASRLNCLRFVDMRDEALPRSALADGPPCAEDAAVCVTGAICKQVRVDRGGGGVRGSRGPLADPRAKADFSGTSRDFLGLLRASRVLADLADLCGPPRISLAFSDVAAIAVRRSIQRARGGLKRSAAPTRGIGTEPFRLRHLGIGRHHWDRNWIWQRAGIPRRQLRRSRMS